MIYQGNNLDNLKTLDANSIDAVVTDPPYGLSFMNKKWDYDVPSVEFWCEVFRVLKPGGHALSFGGTRTYHRMVVNMEDAGFEIRDQVMWLYGSGFPKSHNVSKGIDKLKGAEREVIGVKQYAGPSGNNDNFGVGNNSVNDKKRELTAPATPEVKQWDGWGSALKPANEPICLARKPLEKGLTLAKNVLKYGTGAINIDGCRIGYTSEKDRASETPQGKVVRNNFAPGKGIKGVETNRPDTSQGRWPANIILDEVASESMPIENKQSVSRYFYCAKASKRERNAGLDGMPLKESGIKNNSGRGFSESDPYKKITNQNHHPTVKPIKLMEYLVKLITPPNGVCLDPFMGSGSTGVAAKNLGFDFIGMELDEEYFKIAEKRIGGLDGRN